MNNNTKIQLERIEELLNELEIEYNKSLDEKQISNKALVITSEIIEKLSNLLDQITYKIWLVTVSNNLTETEKNHAKKRIYYPSQSNEKEFKDKLKEWKAFDAENTYPELFNFFYHLQPFISVENDWSQTLKKLARNKHVDLIPQKRQEITNITYSNANGAVMFSAGNVKFGSGVKILGAQIDPHTQRIVPTIEVSEKIEKWVSFKFSVYDLDALGFCKNAKAMAEKIIIGAYNTFNLEGV